MKNILGWSLFIRIILIVWLLVLGNIHFCLWAQTSPSTLDSLQQALKQTHDTKSKVDIYNEITNIYIQKSDSINTIHYFELAQNLSKKHNYWKGLSQAHLGITELYFNKKTNDSLALNHLNESLYAAKQAKSLDLQAAAYKRIGSIHRRKGNYDLALQNYQFALRIYEDIEDQEGIAFIHNNIANVYSSVGNHSLALDYTLKSLNYWEEKNDRQKIGITSNNLGLIYLSQKNYTQALSYFFKSLEILEPLGIQPRIASTSNNLGITFKDLKDYDKSYFYYQKALTIYQELEDDYGIARVLHNLAVSYDIKKEYDKSLRHLEQALEIRKKLNTQYGIASTLIQMGEVYRHLKDYEQAESFLMQGKEMAQEIGRLDKVKTAMGSLAKLYYSQGQYKKAYEANLSFFQLSDSLVDIQSIKQITLMDANYQFQKQLDSLQQVQDEEKRGLESNQMYHLWWIALLIVSMTALILLILVLIGRYKRAKQAIELQKVKQQLLQEKLELKTVEEKMFQEQLLTLEDKDFELTRQALYLVQKRQLLDKIGEEIKDITKSVTKPTQERLKEVIRLIRKETSTGEEWQNFTQTFEMAHPRFFNRLQQNFPELTDKDLKLAALLRLGFDSMELALILNITPNSVRTARMRLRKKLGLNEESLTEFMRNF